MSKDYGKGERKMMDTPYVLSIPQKDIPGMKCMPCEIKPIVEGYLEYKLSKPEYDFADSRKV